MDKYDPKKQVDLLVDEWGTWWDCEPGTNPGHLYQQNTLRDAFVASLSLDVFHKYADRVKMANIAQVANVLQSMILTKEDKMVLTPTYYVFKMYNVHQDATFLPMDITCEKMTARDGRVFPMISSTASKDKNGVVHISISNVSLDKSEDIQVNLGGLKVSKVSGEILTSKNIADYNDFDKKEVVNIKPFKGAKIVKGNLNISLPAKSIVTLTLE